MSHGRKNAFLPLVATLGVQALVSMASTTVPVFAPVAAKQMGIDTTYLGGYVALIYIGGMFSSLMSGDIIIRYGAVRVSQGSLLLCALGIALTAIGTVPLMVLSAILIGFGYGPVTPASSHVLIKTTPPHRLSLMFSLKQTGVPMGGALSGVMIPVLVIYCGWRNAALTVGALNLVMALLSEAVRKTIDDDREPHRKIHLSGVAPFKLVSQDPQIRRITVLSFLFAMLQACLTTYMVTYLTKTLGFSLLRAGLALTVSQAAGICGRIIWGIVADRYVQPRKLLNALGILMAVCAAATSMFNHSWPFALVLVVSAVFGSAVMGWNGVYLAEVARLAPAGKAGVATGGALFFTYLGVVVGTPVFVGLVALTGSYAASYLAVGAPCFVMSVLLMRRPKEKESVEYAQSG